MTLRNKDRTMHNVMNSVMWEDIRVSLVQTQVTRTLPTWTVIRIVCQMEPEYSLTWLFIAIITPDSHQFYLIHRNWLVY
jgi:hypothetical protein